MNRSLTALALCASLTAPALAAQETRQLDAHEHGVSTAEIAVEDDRLAIDLYAPGMDIVGFEYEAETDEDRAAVADAVRQLARVDDIVTVDEAGGCLPIEVLSHLHDEEHEHDDTHDHVEEGEGEEHASNEEDEHGDEATRDGDSHSEFHARYLFDCADTSAITSIGFPFFDVFGNAEEIEAQYVSATGSGAAELERGEATLALD